MPSTVDGYTALLQAWSVAFRQHYAPGIFRQIKRFGKTTRMIGQSKRRMMGNSIEYTVEQLINRGTRVTFDPMAVRPDHRPGQKLTFTVNFDHTNGGTDNDCVVFDLGITTTIFDLKKQFDETYKGEGSFIEEDVNQAIADVQEKFAKYLHLPADGLVGTIDSKKNDDSDILSGASTYTNGSDAALVKMDAFSRARVGEGERIEIRTSAGVLRFNNIIVYGVHPFENTLHIKLTADSVDSAGAATTNLDAIADGDGVYYSGNYNVAPKGSLAAFYAPATLYYGRDRRDPEYKQLMPIRLDPGSGTAVVVTEDHIRDVGLSGSWTKGGFGEDVRVAMIMADDQYKKLAKLAKDGVLNMGPATDAERRRFSLGESGFVLHDPHLGAMPLAVDDFATYGQIDFLDLDTTETVSPISEFGFEMLPGNYTGFWSMENESDGTGRVNPKKFSAYGLMLAAWVWTQPRKNIRLGPLTS